MLSWMPATRMAPGARARSLPGAALMLLCSVSPAYAEHARLLIGGDSPAFGIFDPSVEYAAGAREGWLSYSAVYGSADPWGPHVETRLARTDDAGASWSFERVVHPSMPATLVVPGQPDIDGAWNYEVSSLVHDPSDVAAPWKLFAHRIFRKSESPFTEEQNLPAYSWIVMRTTLDPSEPWGPEIPLLRAGPFPPAPYNVASTAVNGLDPSLASMIAYSEPGAFVQGGTLYLSLSALMPTGPDRIIVLASDDHGVSWRYIGAPLTLVDASALGYLSFDGSAIVTQLGRVLLLVTPESPGILHDGTLVFEFVDIATAALDRVGGVPLIEHSIPPWPGLPAERRGGQADYHAANVAGGILQPSLQAVDYPEFFQIYATGETPLAVSSAPAAGSAACALLTLGYLRIARDSIARAQGLGTSRSSTVLRSSSAALRIASSTALRTMSESGPSARSEVL